MLPGSLHFSELSSVKQFHLSLAPMPASSIKGKVAEKKHTLSLNI